MVGNIIFLMIFAVFDPSLLTLWINCSFSINHNTARLTVLLAAFFAHAVLLETSADPLNQIAGVILSLNSSYVIVPTVPQQLPRNSRHRALQMCGAIGITPFIIISTDVRLRQKRLD